MMAERSLTPSRPPRVRIGRHARALGPGEDLVGPIGACPSKGLPQPIQGRFQCPPTRSGSWRPMAFVFPQSAQRGSSVPTLPTRIPTSPTKTTRYHSGLHRTIRAYTGLHGVLHDRLYNMRPTPHALKLPTTIAGSQGCRLDRLLWFYADGFHESRV